MTLSIELKEGTKESHSAAENTKFVAAFLRGVLNPEEYRKLLANFYFVYSAMEEAIFLTKFASSVTIVHRRDVFRASKIMQERALLNDKIDVIWNSEVIDMLGDEKEKGLESVILRNVITDKKTNHSVEGLFLGIGHSPNSRLFQDYLKVNEKGYIITKPDTSETSLDGVFAAGDIQDTKYMQAVTAAGSGCMAAIDAERYLENLK